MDIVTAEMLAELDPWIQSGTIIVEPANAMYFGRIESRFPIAVNRIDWSKVGSVKEIVLRPSPDSVTIQQMRKEIQGRLHEIRSLVLAFAANDTGNIVAVGDDSSVALRMSIGTLFDCCDILFEQPQHMYVIPETADWCVQYTLEGYLYGGFARNAVAVGWIEDD